MGFQFITFFSYVGFGFWVLQSSSGFGRVMKTKSKIAFMLLDNLEAPFMSFVNRKLVSWNRIYRGLNIIRTKGPRLEECMHWMVEGDGPTKFCF